MILRGFIKNGKPVKCSICGKEVYEYYIDGERIYCEDCYRKKYEMKPV